MAIQGQSKSRVLESVEGDKALKVILYNNVGLIFKGSNDVASTKDLQFFRGFQIF